MGRKRGAAALALLLALLLGGCWDRLQLEDQGYIITLGLDRAETGELVVTARVAIAQPMAAGLLGGRGAAGLAGGQTSQLLTAAGDTVTQAIQTLNGAMTRRLDLRHLRAVVVGESLSRTGLEPVLMELARSPWGRGTALLTQARGEAHDLMRAFRPVAELNPARAVEGLLLVTRALHQGPPVRMHHFIARLAAPGGDPYLPVSAVNPNVAAGADRPEPGPHPSALPGELPRAGGNPVELVGTAVFRDDRLAGYLTVDETQMLLALRGEMGKAYITFPDPTVPGRQATLRFHQENLPRYRAAFRGERPQVEVGLFFEGEVLAVPGGTDYSQPEARARLERAAAGHARQTIRGVLAKLREWEADPAGFGHLFRNRFPSDREWREFNWPEHVPDLQVEVTVDMRIRRFGLFTGPDRASPASEDPAPESR